MTPARYRQPARNVYEFGKTRLAEKTGACRYCGTPLAKPKRGRPPRYCSVGCRRASEYEVRRCNRRLETLEAERDALAVTSAEYAMRDASATAWQRQRHAVRVQAIADQISDYRQRLAELLNDEEPAT